VKNFYSGSTTCVDSVFSFALGPVGSVGYLVNPQNFQSTPTPGVVVGPDARLQVLGLTGQCSAPNTVDVGLLSVFPSEIAITPPFPAAGIFDQVVANETQTVGAESGFILFTPGK